VCSNQATIRWYVPLAPPVRLVYVARRLTRGFGLCISLSTIVPAGWHLSSIVRCIKQDYRRQRVGLQEESYPYRSD